MRPGWQGATREHTSSIRPRSNTARRDAAPVECSRTFTTGCENRPHPSTRRGRVCPEAHMPRALITTVPFGEVDPASLGLLDDAGVE